MPSFWILQKTFKSGSLESFFSFSRRLKVSIGQSLSIDKLSSKIIFHKSNTLRKIELSEKIINHGVSQETVLGLLIFLLYINNVSEKLEGEFDIFQFVEDQI